MREPIIHDLNGLLHGRCVEVVRAAGGGHGRGGDGRGGGMMLTWISFKNGKFRFLLVCWLAFSF